MNEWRDDEVSFLLKHREFMTTEELAKEISSRFGTKRSNVSIIQYCYKHKILKGSTRLNKEETEFLISIADNNWECIIDQFNQRFGRQVKKDALRQVLQSVGIDKRHNYVAGDEVYRNGDGVYIKIDDHSSSSGYRWVKKSRLVYEERFGRIPEGSVIVFLDGNCRNCEPENLMCIDHKVHSFISTKRKYNPNNPEITKAWAKFKELDLRTRGLIED